MDNQQPSSRELIGTSFPTQPKPQAMQNAVAQLMEDQSAMDDWSNNIEKIRQRDIDEANRQTSQKD